MRRESVYVPDQELIFPSPELEWSDGLLAACGDLSPERLLLAYSNDIFPWYGEGSPILWWSPPWRAIVEPAALYVGRSLRKVLRRVPCEVRFDTAFAEILRCCATVKRPGEDGT